MFLFSSQLISFTLVEWLHPLVLRSRLLFQKLLFLVWTIRSCLEISPLSSASLANTSSSSSSIYQKISDMVILMGFFICTFYLKDLCSLQEITRNYHLLYGTFSWSFSTEFTHTNKDIIKESFWYLLQHLCHAVKTENYFPTHFCNTPSCL